KKKQRRINAKTPSCKDAKFIYGTFFLCDLASLRLCVKSILCKLRNDRAYQAEVRDGATLNAGFCEVGFGEVGRFGFCVVGFLLAKDLRNRSSQVTIMAER